MVILPVSSSNCHGAFNERAKFAVITSVNHVARFTPGFLDSVIAAVIMSAIAVLPLSSPSLTVASITMSGNIFFVVDTAC